MNNKITNWLSFFLLALIISACLPFTIGIPGEIESFSLPELKLEFNQPVFHANAPDRAPQLKHKCSEDSYLVLRGTGNIISEARSVGDFTEILLTGLGEVFIAQAESNGLMVQAEENVLPYVETDVAGDQLRLGIDKSVCNLQSEVGITYHVTVKDLNLVHIIGAGEIQIEQLQTESLNIELDGSARIVLAELRSDTLQVHVNGTGVIQLAGEVASQTVKPQRLWPVSSWRAWQSVREYQVKWDR